MRVPTTMAPPVPSQSPLCPPPLPIEYTPRSPRHEPRTKSKYNTHAFIALDKHSAIAYTHGIKVEQISQYKRTNTPMTKKHYIAIAEVLRERYEKADGKNAWRVREIAEDLAIVFAKDNPLFDTFRFYQAIGLK